jgi:aryl-alcohol dehydrogenase-like predicted oxidoreductase
MEYRFLGASGFRVPVLGLGTGTFGGKGPLFSAWGRTDVDEATRLVDVCLDAGVNLFDTADVYSDGASEFILGAAIKGRRHDVLVSTKVSIRSGQGPNDVGASRHHLLRTVDRSLERLGTDYIDLLQLHHFDAMTPVESVMRPWRRPCEVRMPCCARSAPAQRAGSGQREPEPSSARWRRRACGASSANRALGSATAAKT